MSAANTPTTSEFASFEAQLQELAEITTALEQGAPGLDESLAKFERGIQLLRNCRQMLAGAEHKIELLTGFDANGQPVTQPFDAAATFTPTATDAATPKKAGRRAAAKKSTAAETIPTPVAEESREASPTTDEPEEPTLF